MTMSQISEFEPTLKTGLFNVKDSPVLTLVSVAQICFEEIVGLVCTLTGFETTFFRSTEIDTIVL